MEGVVKTNLLWNNRGGCVRSVLLEVFCTKLGDVESTQCLKESMRKTLKIFKITFKVGGTIVLSIFHYLLNSIFLYITIHNQCHLDIEQVSRRPPTRLKLILDESFCHSISNFFSFNFLIISVKRYKTVAELFETEWKPLYSISKLLWDISYSTTGIFIWVASLKNQPLVRRKTTKTIKKLQVSFRCFKI